MARSTSMRQSCDRCHRQKLRCERLDDSDTAACSRCLRRDSPCVYSYSLPKGRPNQHRHSATSHKHSSIVNDTKFGSKIDSKTNFKSTTRPFSKRSADTLASSDSSLPAITSCKKSLNAAVEADKRTKPPLQTDGLYSQSDDAEQVEIPRFCSQPAKSLTSHTAPWLEELEWGNARLRPEGSNRIENPDGSLSSNHLEQSISSGAFLPQHPEFHNEQWETDATTLIDNCPSFHNPGVDQELLHLNNMEMDGQDAIIARMNETTSMDTNGHESEIARLLGLSTRLYPLHNSAHALVDSTMTPTSMPCLGISPKSDLSMYQALLQSLGSLGGCETRAHATGNRTAPDLSNVIGILQETMLASYTFLEILNRFQTDANAQSTFGYSPLLTPISTPSSPGELSCSNMTMVSHAPSSVARHLIMACYEMLLSVYTAVFGVMQRNAESATSPNYTVGLNDAKGRRDAQILPELPLVMTVEMCAYIISHQKQSFDSYLMRYEHISDSSDPAGSTKAPPPSALEMKMRDELARLRLTLRI